MFQKLPNVATSVFTKNYDFLNSSKIWTTFEENLFSQEH